MNAKGALAKVGIRVVTLVVGIIAGVSVAYAQFDPILKTSQTLQNTPPAGEVRDWIKNPFVDPLNTRPPVLDFGKALPGDSEVLSCSDTTDPSKIKSDNTVASLRTKPLSLTDAVDWALCRNPQVQSAWASIKVQAAAVGEARAAYLPTIVTGVSRLSDKFHYPDTLGFDTAQLSNTTFESLTWRLFDFGGRAANRKSANALLDAAMASHDAALQKTMMTIIGTYFDAQTAWATQVAKQKDESLAKQTLDAVRRREDKGAGSQSDTLQAITALAKVGLDRSRAEGTYRKAMSNLMYTMGVPATELMNIQLALADDLVDTESGIRQDLTTWLEQAQDHHPAIVAARAQFESIKQKLIVIKSGGLPTIDFFFNRYQNGRPTQGINPLASVENQAGITLTVPVFDGFSTTYKVRGAEAQIEEQEAILRDTQNQILTDVVKAHADALAALNNLMASQKLIEAAQNALMSVQRKYDRGASDVIELLNAQIMISDAKQQRISALADWRSARLRLLANVGVLGRQALSATSKELPASFR